MGFNYLKSDLPTREEAVFAINASRDLSYELCREAFEEVLNEKNITTREHFMTLILNGLMAKGPTVLEATGLLDAVFEYDNFEFKKRPFFPGESPSITIAGSGKKGLKTVNLSSLSSFVAACFGPKILKLCSPATSSSTGSQDFISILSGGNDWKAIDMAQLVQELGIGFFPVESVFPRFASIYSGRFFAPHAMSFALAGMASKFKTNKMLYGLAHPNTSLSVEIYRHYELPQVMVISSTPDGIHYLDEAISAGGTLVEGYKSLESKPKRQGIVYFGEILRSNENERVFESISQEKDQIKNVIKGLSGLSGSNPVLSKQLAINAAIILFIVYGGNIAALYDKCFDAIKSGTPINKLREFISRTDGNVSHFDKLLLASKSFKINN